MGLKLKNTLFSRLNLEGLYNTFLGLQPRQQMFALIGVGAALLLLVGFPISLASGKLSGLEEEIQNGRQTQRDIVRALERYHGTRSNLKAVEEKLAKGYDSTLTTTMATLGEKIGIKTNIENIQDRGSTPSELFDEITVEVRLTKIMLQQLVDYLYNIEHHPNFYIRIKEMRIKRRYDNRQQLDASFLASTYHLQETVND